MPVKNEWIRYGDQIGYLSMPEGAAMPLPGVVVIQEVGGVNENIEDIAGRIAAAGRPLRLGRARRGDGKAPRASARAD